MKTCPRCGVEYPDATTLCPADGEALEKDPDALVGMTLAGKYRIDARLNEGGMGTVYRGTHVLMDKTVAIKVLRPSLAADEKIVARFSREARAASRISHPNALSVTDFGEDESGHVFLVMEYLSGKTLKQVIREEALCRWHGWSISRGRSETRSTLRTNRESCIAISRATTSCSSTR